jgi:integrase
MLKKLNRETVNDLTPSKKPYEVRDTDIKGFLLRVQPSGVMTYYYEYRTQDGRKQRSKIGPHPSKAQANKKKDDSVTVTAARKAALQFSADVIKGGDPHREKKQARIQRETAMHKSLGGFIKSKYTGWALTHQKRGDETLALLQADFSHLNPKRMDKISAWDVQKWRTEKTKSGLKPATINRRVTTLKAVLNKAVEWDVIDVNPISKIKPLKIDTKSRIRYLSQAEESSLRVALDAREADLRSGRESGNLWRAERGYEAHNSLDGEFADHLKPMVLLAVNTGMRRGELFDLMWGDVDLQKKTVTIEGKTAKTGNTRHIPLNSEAIKILRAWYGQASGEGLVFISPATGSRFDNIKTAWSNLRTRAAIKDFRFHDLRHTFASKLVTAGVDLYTVKELMGHSTIQMTERYAHLAPEHKAKAVEVLVS